MTRLALDRATVRTLDVDGRLHLAPTNISKATVSPYYGHEIPGAKELGLDPNTVYYMLRDPIEMEKAAGTFNNLPILSEHVPVSADEHMPEIVVGSTGTDAVFDDPYLQNTAVIWARTAIDGVESDEQKEWSCAYYYKADMTPGKFRGLQYDGIMRDIVANHLALVAEGRAGPDVVVGDSKAEMPKMVKLRNALAKKIATDEGIDVDDVIKVIAAVSGEAPAAGEDDEIPPAESEEDTQGMDADGEKCAALLNWLKGKVSDEDYAEAAQLAQSDAAADEGGPDEEDKPDDDPEDKPVKGAMDAASVQKMLRAAEDRGAQRQVAIRNAERDVFPLVGEIVAMDSAEAVYLMALDTVGIKAATLKGVPLAGLKVMVDREVAHRKPASAVAMDHAAISKARGSFAEMYPAAVRS